MVESFIELVRLGVRTKLLKPHEPTILDTLGYNVHGDSLIKTFIWEEMVGV